MGQPKLGTHLRGGAKVDGKTPSLVGQHKIGGSSPKLCDTHEARQVTGQPNPTYKFLDFLTCHETAGFPISSLVISNQQSDIISIIIIRGTYALKLWMELHVLNGIDDKASEFYLAEVFWKL